MSTDLYGIRILDVQPAEKRMRMRVFVVYYDTHYEYHQPIPSDRSFFVRVLCDKEALGDDIADEDRFDEGYVNRNAFRYVDRFVELSNTNFPLESYEGYSDFYYERDGGWVDEDKLVQADYDLFVTKEEYLEPFEVGQSWGTTSYETESDNLTADEYMDIPEFGDVRTFIPFGDLDGEHTVVRTMRFSPDNKYLLASNNEGGMRVFDTKDHSIVLDMPEAGDWVFEPGWMADGRISWQKGDAYFATDLDGNQESIEFFGFSANSDGTRYLTGMDAETCQILNNQGEVLYEAPREPDVVAYAGFDGPGDHCILFMEMDEEAQLIDLRTGDTRPIAIGRVTSLALSPDAKYILAATFQSDLVVRAEDGQVIRMQQERGRIPTAVAWSKDGTLAATSSCDNNGYNSRISYHRMGSAVDAELNAPMLAPEPKDCGVVDFVNLFVEKTSTFHTGWNSHLDDNYIDYHLALKTRGDAHDLVPVMRESHSKLMARAYESALVRGRDADAADKALAQAMELVTSDIAEWSYTQVYAPLAAAQYLAGNTDKADEFLELAKVKLEDEANAFQKRAILGRALLFMGRNDEVVDIVRDWGKGRLWWYNFRLMATAVRLGAFDVVEAMVEHWGFGDDWDATKALQKELTAAGEFERIFDYELSEKRGGALEEYDAWSKWFDVDEATAQARLVVELEARPDSEAVQLIAFERGLLTDKDVSDKLMNHWEMKSLYVSKLLVQGSGTHKLDSLDDDAKVKVCHQLAKAGRADLIGILRLNFEGPALASSLACEQRWDDLYQLFTDTKATLRHGLFEATMTACVEATGDLHIALNVLNKMSFGDMNSPGLRAAQSAIKHLFGGNYVEYRV